VHCDRPAVEGFRNTAGHVIVIPRIACPPGFTVTDRAHLALFEGGARGGKIVQDAPGMCEKNCEAGDKTRSILEVSRDSSPRG